MSRPQGMPDCPHVNPPQRLRIHRRPPPPTPPTQDSPDEVPGTPVTPQHISSVPLSVPTPPPFMDRQGPSRMQLSRHFQSPKRPDTPRQRSQAPLHVDNKNALVMKGVSEVVEEDITSEDASAIVREKRVSKEFTFEPATTEQKARSKKKMTKVKRGWDRMLRLFSNKAEDREARRRREVHETHQRWHRAQTALSSGSGFFDFGDVTLNALGGIRYSIPTPARSREHVARLASRSTLYITDGSTPPPLPIRRDRRIEPAEPQTETSPRRRKNERRPSDEKKRARP